MFGVEVILGIDPGTRNTGYAVVRQQGRQLTLLDSGTIRLGPRKDLATRLGELLQALDGVLSRNEPQSVAVEDVFSHRNARSALLLGQARGVALAVAAQRGLAVDAYPPATVKQAVTGHGRADKQQVQRMVQHLLGLDRSPQADEADAMAVAICHAMSGATRGR